MGLVRAVDVGRRWNFFDVALRCCFAYSLEHYHSCLRTFSLRERTRQQMLTRPHGSRLSGADYNIARRDAQDYGRVAGLNPNLLVRDVSAQNRMAFGAQR